MTTSVSRTPSSVSHHEVCQMDCSNQLALPAGYLPFAEFTQKFSFEGTSTEKVHEKTKTLSQTMRADVVKGLEMLFDADQAVLAGFEQFIPAIQSLAPDLAARMKAGGRVFSCWIGI